MKKIVIIGANSFQNPLILKAKDLGYETHVFAWRDGSIGEETADFFYPISILEKEKILEECKKIKPVAVVTIASDLAGYVVNYLARNLGLPCNSEECSLISTNKYAMRRAFQESNVPTPGFVKVGIDSSIDSIKGLKYPLIVKPTDRSGSRGVTKIMLPEEWKAAVEVACENSFEKKAITEEYIEGEEYSCECISYRGEHTYLTLTKKYTTGHPHFIETGHLQPAGIEKASEEKIKRVIFSALDALKIQNGASHTEFKMDDKGKIGIIEIGSRMGGDCIGSDLVPLSTGYDFVRMVIDVAMGNEPDFKRVGHFGASAIRFIYDQKDLDCLKKIQKEYPEKIKYISDIKMGKKEDIVDSSSRFGYFIIACDQIDEAKRLLEL